MPSFTPSPLLCALSLACAASLCHAQSQPPASQDTAAAVPAATTATAPATAPAPVAPAGVPTNAAGIAMPAGHYKCELNRSVHVRQVAPDLQSAVVQWDKKDYAMKAVEARSGALRFEDAVSGLVWIVIHGKSMLLDTKLGRQLANECRT